jgi:DNA (cytosine-5)-methyltransferase 1
VEHADSSGRQELRGAESVSTPLTRVECASNPWERYILIECADGKSRRIESGLAPLVDGIPGRVGMLRGYGNAIVPTLAAQFVRAFMDARLVN